jgi:hypothetical protein
MSDTLDKAEKLLEQEEAAPKTPTQKNQVLFLSSKSKAAAGGKAAGSRTRPSGSRFNKPTKEDLAYYEETAEERKKFIEEDAVVKSAEGKDPLALLSTLKTQVAREAAALVYQRVQHEMMGRDITQIAGRRIDALKKIADIEMEMRKIGFDQINVYSEKFQKIFKLWIEIIQYVAQETLAPEQLDLFFNRLQSEMDGWEEKAENLVR